MLFGQGSKPVSEGEVAGLLVLPELAQIGEVLGKLNGQIARQLRDRSLQLNSDTFIDLFFFGSISSSTTTIFWIIIIIIPWQVSLEQVDEHVAERLKIVAPFAWLAQAHILRVIPTARWRQNSLIIIISTIFIMHPFFLPLTAARVLNSSSRLLGISTANTSLII